MANDGFVSIEVWYKRHGLFGTKSAVNFLIICLTINLSGYIDHHEVTKRKPRNQPSKAEQKHFQQYSVFLRLAYSDITF